MKSYDVKKLINVLNHVEQTAISSEEIESYYNSIERSDLVAKTIYSVVEQCPTNYLQYPYGTPISVKRYLMEAIPKINFGRRFGHTRGLVNYLLSIQNSRSKKVCLLFSNEQLKDNFFSTLKSMCDKATFSQILFNINRSSDLLTSTNPDLIVFVDYINTSDLSVSLCSFVQKQVALKTPIISVGDLVL